MRNIVFLDIDGVINSSKNYEEWDRLNMEDCQTEDTEWRNPADDKFMSALFDPDNIAILNRITAACDASIVISSSWRLMYSSPEKYELLKKTLHDSGVEAPIIGRTPPQIPDRAGAIDFWLKNSEDVTGYVILDDYGIETFGYYLHLMKHLMQTDGETGLVDLDVSRTLSLMDLPR